MLRNVKKYLRWFFNKNILGQENFSIGIFIDQSFNIKVAHYHWFCNIWENSKVSANWNNKECANVWHFRHSRTWYLCVLTWIFTRVPKPCTLDESLPDNEVLNLCIRITQVQAFTKSLVYYKHIYFEQIVFKARRKEFYVFCLLLYVHSSFAIILMGRRELVALFSLSSWCLMIFCMALPCSLWLWYFLIILTIFVPCDLRTGEVQGHKAMMPI